MFKLPILPDISKNTDIFFVFLALIQDEKFLKNIFLFVKSNGRFDRKKKHHFNTLLNIPFMIVIIQL